MSRVLILGAGISGHTAASFLKRFLGSDHEVVVVSPKSHYNWLPSNIWVGVGGMRPDEVLIELAPVYRRAGIEFHQAGAVSIHPEGSPAEPRPHVTIESTVEATAGATSRVTYDWLINATGPQLNFAATPGLGPDGHSWSVCTAGHAAETSAALDVALDRMRKGERLRILVGTGHGMATCQGAAFEYAFNVEHKIRRLGLRDRAEITWISNEYELGDFGMGGLHVKRGGYVTHSKIFTESLYAQRGVRWITRAHVKEVTDRGVAYETLDGEEKELAAEFMMLLPPFKGVPMRAFDRADGDITDQVFAPNGFMKVDADYGAKPFEEWQADDWPRTYRSPDWPNVFAVGIAFAPPHPISRPRQSPNGTPIFATPPRTGMPSAMMARAVAHTVADEVRGTGREAHTASMAHIGAACVASAGTGFFRGTAAAMTVYPIVPDFERFPEYGRDVSATWGEIGLAGHWIKHFLHHMFIYKARMRPGWHLIPE